MKHHQDAKADTELLAQLEAFVGGRSAPRIARDPVNVPMARQWCDAMGDRNPLYTDAACAADGPFGELVAPPAMLEVWDKPGPIPSPRANPRDSALALLRANGFVAVAAVDLAVEPLRYVRPGELLTSVMVLDDISAEKQTSLGEGHFVTTRSTYTSQDGEHVGEVLMRDFRFRPGTARPPGTADDLRPDPDPSLRPRPGINRDNSFFWEGARAHELRVQTCDVCAAAHFPPKPRCSECGSFDLGWIVSKGRGTVYAWAVPHHPQANGFTYPLLVVLVELEEGVRIVSNLIGVERAQLRIGMPVEVCWLDSHPALVEGSEDSRGPISLPQFRPRPPDPRTEMIVAAEVTVGDELPLFAITVTPTLVVSTALASRDFAPVHLDRDRALRVGAKDISLNIDAWLGLSQRYVTDILGPETLVRRIHVRLLAPSYCHETITLIGEVSSVDVATGETTVAFRGFSALGDHVTGTADLVLPGGSAYAPFVRGVGSR